jgi:nucleoside phosphorylase
LNLLIAAAWEPELAHFRARWSAEGAAHAPAVVVMEPIGVGLVDAAIGMTRCLERHRPELALFLGTAGAFAEVGASGIALGQVVAGRLVHLLDAGLVAGTTSLPGPMAGEALLDPAMHDALVAAGAVSVQIANTVGVTVDDALASRLSAARGDAVEHLEAFAFARACAALNVRCGVVLGVANTVGARGRGEWLANHTSASASAADVAWAALPALTALVRRTTRAPSPERA